jgi:hypothetical protein
MVIIGYQPYFVPQKDGKVKKKHTETVIFQG